MFSLLNPIAFWLAPLLVAPLAIHLMGRTRPKLKDFPSLIPIQGHLAKTMKRHRLKNWLQLIVRTMAIAALLLAAAKPMWQPKMGFSPPTQAGLLFYNGAYATVPISATQVVQDELQLLQHVLDSITDGHSHTVPLLSDRSLSLPAARFGGYSEGLSKLFSLQTKANETYHVHLPIFDWGDIQETLPLIHNTFKRLPQLKLVLHEFPSVASTLTPFHSQSLTFPKTGMTTIRLALNPLANTPSSILWHASGQAREALQKNDSIEVQVPMATGWLEGFFEWKSNANKKFAYNTDAVVLRIPPPSSLCQVTDDEAIASTLSLGPGNTRLIIRTVFGADQQPMESCDALLFSGLERGNAIWLGQAAERLRSGGKVILSVGRHMDAALWNRQLLTPLNVGRFLNLEKGVAKPIEINAKGFQKLGWDYSTWGKAGQASALLDFQADSGTTVLLTMGTHPLLLHRRIGKGELLLWTTHLDDPEWSDLGLGPWLALLHQKFLASAGLQGIQIHRMSSDSTFQYFNPHESPIEVLGPQKMPFQRMHQNSLGWSIGPFDQLGLYRLTSRSDTLHWAVVLDSSRRLLSKRSWAEGKGQFILGLKEMHSKVLFRESGFKQSLYSGQALRMPFLWIAALLLLLEGLISLRLASTAMPKRQG